MSNLVEVVKSFDDAIDMYYGDGYYPGVSEQRMIDNLKYDVIKEAHKAVKEVKAIKIIKTKNVNIAVLKNSPDLKYYNYHVSDWRKLIDEEFDLLKEVLKDES